MSCGIGSSGGRCLGLADYVTGMEPTGGAIAAVHRSEAHTHAIFEAASDAILIVDERGTITSANRKSQEMFGYAREALQPMVTEVSTMYPPSHPGYCPGVMLA
jgi:PAS domain-containing protein